MPIKQSVSWWCFENRVSDTISLLKKVKEIGYGGVDLIGVEHFPAVLDSGLEIVAIGGHDSIDRGLNNPEDHDRIEKEILNNLEVAKQYGVLNLIVFSGVRRPDLTDDAGIVNTVAGLNRVAKAAEDAGVGLVMELLNSKVDHKLYQCDTTAWGSEVIRQVGSPNVKLLYDIYHASIMEGDIIRTIRAGHEYIGHYHTAGNPGRNDLDSDQEIYYPAVYRAIQNTGFSGYIGHEFIPKGDSIKALEDTYRQCVESFSRS
jgi:hydroxypyruvate isomerase